MLDPMLEKQDAHQIAYIRKILNKIKSHDDGLATAAIAGSVNNPAQNKIAIQNLYIYNKVKSAIFPTFFFG